MFMEYNVNIHYVCSCCNKNCDSSKKYCRSRYDKIYDIKHDVWSSTSNASHIPFDQNRSVPYQNRINGQYSKVIEDVQKNGDRKMKKKTKYTTQFNEVHNQNFDGKYRGKQANVSRFVWKYIFSRLRKDWVFLALLGIIMATISFLIDRAITMVGRCRLWLYLNLKLSFFTMFMAWITPPICLILLTVAFVRTVAPQSIGSGIPEMKTILRGVHLKGYLTLRTLIAKIVGLTTTLGSGLPVGKEGPLVHIACIVASLLSKFIISFPAIYEHESSSSEMLACACAVGVASCFGAPIGGVLFSIEVTTVYFAIRNYWRGFFSAVCGASVLHFLAIIFYNEETIKPLFPTHFHTDFPFDPQELIIFALIGLVCGFGGAAYVWSHRQYVLLIRGSKKINTFLQKNWFLYPGIVMLLVSSILFPPGLGKYMASDLNTHGQLLSLFSNFSWTKDNFTMEEQHILKHWTTSSTNVFVSLAGFMLYTYIFSIIASTLQVPCGIFISVFKIGAAFGRFVGEIVFLRISDGGRIVSPIIPGGYAIVGAAAFSGAVTHTISVSVLIFEMTGQLTHIIPVMIAVLISNAVAVLLQPSVYDSIILIKKLPFLPDLLLSKSDLRNIYIEDFMVREVKYIWKGMTYRELNNLLEANNRIQVFPLVESPANMILIGSVYRNELAQLLAKHIGRKRRIQAVAEQQIVAREKFEQRERKKTPYDHNRASYCNLLWEESFKSLQSCPDLTVFGCQSSEYMVTTSKLSSLNKFNTMRNLNVNPEVSEPESRIAKDCGRKAFKPIFHKSETLQNDTESENEPKERTTDMSFEDQNRWEEKEMNQKVNFEQCHIDPAPFQMIERTSLPKVHTIFSSVRVHHAFVTNIGKLSGVVGLKELKKAVEDANSGIERTEHRQMPVRQQ